MKKPAFCICENKDADQLCSNCAADQRLCFCYTDSTIPLPPKSVISSLYPSSVAVQPGLCQTWSETPKTGLSQRGSLQISQNIRILHECEVLIEKSVLFLTIFNVLFFNNKMLYFYQMFYFLTIFNGHEKQIC